MNERTKAQIWGGILAFLAALGSTGALATGMRLESASLSTLISVFALAAMVFSVTLGFKGFPAVPGVLALAGIWLWFRGQLNLSVEALVFQCSCLYDMGYGVGTLRWSETPQELLDPTLALCVIGIAVMLCVSWTVARGKSVWAAVTLTFLPLVPCLLLTDTVPLPFFLFLQLLTILLLILTGSVRRRSLPQGNALTVLVLVPSLLALLALFFFLPQEGYTGDAVVQKIEDWVVSLFQASDEPEPTSPNLPPLPAQPTREKISLSAVGPTWKWNIPVMTVTGTQSGHLYLREKAYDSYDGTNWESDLAEEENPFLLTSGTMQQVKIHTLTLHDYLFLPYGTRWIDNPRSGNRIYRGSVENTSQLTDYTVGYIPVYIPSLEQTDSFGGHYIDRDTGIRTDGTSGNPASQLTDARYLALPEGTRATALAILARDIPELNNLEPLEQANAICSYVQSSATYSLATAHMPENEDFALWFLMQSDTGYCVHFATATAVLLRAAGIPSRYVTGYLTDVRAGEEVTVMEKSAHAWVEANIAGQWIMLEPTPGDGIVQTVGTESTEPEETTQPTETTVPSTEAETTAPTETEEATASQPSTETTAPPSTKPSGTAPVGGSDAPTPPKEPFRLPKWVKVLLWIAGFIGAVIGQWQLRVFLRRKRWNKGSTNAQALARWQDVRRYARLLGKDPNPQLYELALKAKFSQHTLTREELRLFGVALDSDRRKVWDRKLHIRLIATLILALH